LYLKIWSSIKIGVSLQISYKYGVDMNLNFKLNRNWVDRSKIGIIKNSFQNLIVFKQMRWRMFYNTKSRLKLK